MLRKIRNIKTGWMLILLGIISTLSGISKAEGKAGEKTFLCFDDGCIYIQGISNIVIGILFIGIGIFNNIKK